MARRVYFARIPAWAQRALVSNRAHRVRIARVGLHFHSTTFALAPSWVLALYSFLHVPIVRVNVTTPHYSMTFGWSRRPR